jgi:hypothetical protein
VRGAKKKGAIPENQTPTERASLPIQDLLGELLQRLKRPRLKEQHAKQDMQPGVLARPKFGKPSSGRPNSGKLNFVKPREGVPGRKELARSALGERKSERRGVEKRKKFAELHTVQRKSGKLRFEIKQPSGMSADEPETLRK